MTRMTPLLAETLEALRGAGWTVELASSPKPLPPHVAERYPALPPLAVEFFTSVENCVRGDEGCCLFAAADFANRDEDGMGWDHIERVFTEPSPSIEGIRDRPLDPDDVAATRRFWDAHLPIFGYWLIDYEYLAIVADRAAEDHGAVVHGYIIDFDSPGPIAPSYEAFLAQLRDVALGPPTRSAVYENYLALLVHADIIEDGSTPPWEKGLRARLRRWFAGARRA